MYINYHLFIVLYNIFSFKYYTDTLQKKIVTNDSVVFSNSISKYNDYFSMLELTLYNLSLDRNVAKVVDGKEYWQYEMIDVIKELLKEDSKKIQDVAVETGFNSIHSFIRTFKRYTDKTPNEYRKNYA